MKALIIIATFIILCFSISSFSQTSKLSLEIEILPELKNTLINEEIDISLFQKGKVTKTICITSDRIIVLFDSLLTSEFDFHLNSYIKKRGFERDYTLYSGFEKLYSDSTFSLKITFPKNCQYNKNGENNICPKCKRSDKVIPILYGLRVPVFDENGNLKEIDPPHFPGGCNVTNCDPAWYCKRNKLKF